MLQSKDLRKIRLDLQRRLLVVLTIASVMLLLSAPALSGSPDQDEAPRYNLGLFTLHAEAKTAYGQSLEPAHASFAEEALAPEPYVVPLSVDLQIAQHVSSDLETGLNVYVTMPSGCYRSRIKVEHLGDFSHRLTPTLVAEPRNCSLYSRFDHQVVSLGQLAPGLHEVVVGNTVKPAEKRSFWVHEADLSAANRARGSHSGG